MKFTTRFLLSLAFLSQTAFADEELRTRSLSIKNMKASIGYTFEKGTGVDAPFMGPYGGFNHITMASLVLEQPATTPGYGGIEGFLVSVSTTVYDVSPEGVISSYDDYSSASQTVLSCAIVNFKRVCVGPIGTMVAGRVKMANGHELFATTRIIVRSTEDGIIFDARPLE